MLAPPTSSTCGLCSRMKSRMRSASRFCASRLAPETLCSESLTIRQHLRRLGPGSINPPSSKYALPLAFIFSACAQRRLGGPRCSRPRGRQSRARALRAWPAGSAPTRRPSLAAPGARARLPVLIMEERRVVGVRRPQRPAQRAGEHERGQLPGLIQHGQRGGGAAGAPARGHDARPVHHVLAAVRVHRLVLRARARSRSRPAPVYCCRRCSAPNRSPWRPAPAPGSQARPPLTCDGGAWRTLPPIRATARSHDSLLLALRPCGHAPAPPCLARTRQELEQRGS